MSGFSLTSGSSIDGFDTSNLTLDAGETLYSLGNPIGYGFSNDATEAAKLSQFYPTQSAGGLTPDPWWQSLAKYGVTRAIDAAVGPQSMGTGNQQSTYAGQNGQTYVNGQAVNKAASDNMLLLLIVGGVLYAMSD